MPSRYNLELKIEVIGIDDLGKTYKLLLHTESDPNKEENIFLDYKDVIDEGDIIEEKLKKALKEDFDITEVRYIDLIEEPIDELEVNDTDSIEYTAKVKVKYRDENARKIGDVYADWFEM